MKPFDGGREWQRGAVNGGEKKRLLADLEALKPPPQDFISLFMDYTESTISPDIFRRWSGIALLGGALERRCYARVGEYKTYPNQFIMFVARPGVGKYIIEDVGELWTDTNKPGRPDEPAFHVAPSNMTKASLLDEMALATQTYLPAHGPLEETHPLLVAAEEMSVLVPKYDLEYIGVLNKIWNNPPVHSETRRTGNVKRIKIVQPQLNLLCGAQPGWLSSVFPDEAWSTGLTSRMLMIYAADPPEKDIFGVNSAKPHLRKQILARLSSLSTLWGEWTLAPHVVGKLGAWGRFGPPPVPTHSKLENYITRRTLHLIKLAFVAAVARDQTSRTIAPLDLDRGMAWLLEIEELMPDIFRAMKGKSDHEVIEELHYHLTTLYSLSGGKSVHASRLWDFLRERVPSERIGKILEVAERADVISRDAGLDTYKPRPRFDHRGVE